MRGLMQMDRFGRRRGVWGRAAVIAVAALAMASVGYAGLVTSGDPFPVNDVAVGDQAVPRAAVSANGRSMVVWDSTSDGDDQGVVGRVYGSNGAPVGSEFQINTYTSGAQFGPVVGALSSGGFVVVWESYDFAGGADLLFGRRFSAEGTPLGSEFRVDISISEFHAQPDLAVQADGGFVVVWNDYFDVFGLRLDNGGAPVGSEFRVNASTGGVSDARIASAADGSFVVSWTDSSEIDGDGLGILARRFAASGAPQGGDLQVNSTTVGDQYNPGIGMSPAGNFMVVWETYAQSGLGDGLFGQRFAAGGGDLGTEFRVDPGNSVYAGAGSVAANQDGDFVVVWDEPRGGEGYNYSVMARRVDASGALAQEVFDVGADSNAYQSQAHIAADVDGGFLVVWREDLTQGDIDIFGQRLAAPGTPAPRCDGDCDGNGVVSVNELIKAVNISLGLADVSDCSAADANGDGVVSVNELILAVNSSLYGC